MRMMIQVALLAFFRPAYRLPAARRQSLDPALFVSSKPSPQGRTLFTWFRSKGVSRRLLRLGVEVLLEGDAELFPEGLELLQVLVVLALVLNLRLDACDAQSAQCFHYELNLHRHGRTNSCDMLQSSSMLRRKAAATHPRKSGQRWGSR